MLHKFIRYAQKLGIDPEEFLNMTVFDAIMEVQKVQDMWKQLPKDSK
jgi:hypothetical protein